VARRRGPRKGKGYSNPPFVGLPIRMVRRCDEWKNLSSSAKILYIYIKSKYNGSNNGEIKFSYSEIKGVKGCATNRTISRAIKELESNEWICKTKIGGLYRYYNLYKLTFKYDDFC
jgi:hypothetical protein